MDTRFLDEMPVICETLWRSLPEDKEQKTSVLVCPQSILPSPLQSPCKPVSIPLAITPYYVHLPSYQILLFECFPISSFLNPFISIFLSQLAGGHSEHPLTVCREMWRRTEIKISGYLFKRELWVINHFLYMSRFFLLYPLIGAFPKTRMKLSVKRSLWYMVQVGQVPWPNLLFYSYPRQIFQMIPWYWLMRKKKPPVLSLYKTSQDQEQFLLL